MAIVLTLILCVPEISCSAFIESPDDRQTGANLLSPSAGSDYKQVPITFRVTFDIAILPPDIATLTMRCHACSSGGVTLMDMANSSKRMVFR